MNKKKNREKKLNKLLINAKPCNNQRTIHSQLICVGIKSQGKIANADYAIVQKYRYIIAFYNNYHIYTRVARERQTRCDRIFK